MVMVIIGRGCLGSIDGTIKKLEANDPIYQTSDAQNSIAMVYLINSMEDNIGENYLYHS